MKKGKFGLPGGKYTAYKFLAVFVAILSLFTFASVLFFGSYGNAGGKPAEAAVNSNYASNTYNKPTSSGYYYTSMFVYVYMDTNWGGISVGSISYTKSSTSVSYVWTSMKVTYSVSGYSWSSSAPTSITMTARRSTSSNYSDSSSLASSDYSYLSSGSYSYSYAMTRSGNVFTYSSDWSRSVSASTSSSYHQICVFTCYIQLESSYFTANTYTLYYDPNGGTVSTTQISVTYKSTNVSPPTPSRTNYSFVGWYFGSTRYTGGTWTYTSSKTAKAKWGCTVSFDSMGGSACANMTVNTDETYTSLPTPTRTGYTFVGWYKNSSFSGDMVTTSGVVQENHTLYAKWNCTVSYEVYGGSACEAVTVQVDSVYGTLPTTTWSGYSFDGWYREATYTGNQVSPTDIITVGHTLYAKWTSTINLDQQGGSGGSANIKGTYNVAMPEAVAPTRMGFAFGGYYSGTNGSGTQYYSDNMSSNHVWDLVNGTSLYAKWTVAKYTLYYNANGGSVSASEQIIEFGTNVTLQTPTKTGYTFLGWYMDGEPYNGGTWTFIENKTVNAKWGYSLTYDPNGGYVAPGNLVVIDGDVITPPTPTREGCTFAGWKIGSNIYYGGLWSFSANQTAVAQWTATLLASCDDDKMGYITGSADGVYAVGANISLVATAEMGYIFDCWVINNRKVKTATYSGAINQHTTAVAHFKRAQPTANVTATNGTIASTLLSVDEENFGATLRITPESNKYVDEISFDNVAYYKIDSWSTKLYASSSFAQNVAYQANEGNNDLWLTFNYYNTTKSVNVYVKLTTTKYANLTVPKNEGGALDGIAVCANYGGSVTLIGADYETLADSDTIICSAKLAQSGYEFVGWCFADSQSNILSTEESARFLKSQVYGRQLMAKFQPTADNPNYNLTLNNE